MVDVFDLVLFLLCETMFLLPVTVTTYGIVLTMIKLVKQTKIQKKEEKNRLKNMSPAKW